MAREKTHGQTHDWRRKPLTVLPLGAHSSPYPAQSHTPILMHVYFIAQAQTIIKIRLKLITKQCYDVTYSRPTLRSTLAVMNEEELFTTTLNHFTNRINKKVLTYNLR